MVLQKRAKKTPAFLFAGAVHFYPKFIAAEN